MKIVICSINTFRNPYLKIAEELEENGIDVDARITERRAGRATRGQWSKRTHL